MYLRKKNLDEKIVCYYKSQIGLEIKDSINIHALQL